MQTYEFPELREGVRQVVSQFDSRYWQEVDEARARGEAVALDTACSSALVSIHLACSPRNTAARVCR